MRYLTLSMFKTVRVVIFTIVLVTTTIPFASCKQKQKSASILGYSTQLFAADLFTKLGEGNQLISPLVIQSGLSLLPVQGLAKNELIRSLHLSNLNYWTNSYKNFLTSICHSKNIEIKSANAIYVSDKTHYLSSYKKMMMKYGAELQSVDFSKADIVAREINQWVETKTNNKIRDIVNPASLSSTTEALLITALYFNGDWEKQFLQEATFSGHFYPNGEEENKITIDMMTQTSDFNYAENKDIDAKFLELPYENKDYSMTIVLPNQRHGLPNVERYINEIFENQNMTSRKVFVNLPKFNFTNKVELTDVLKKLGLISIFNNGVSFGNSRDKFQVSNIIQKTYVDVNEVGTEAAAVMEVEMTSRLGFYDLATVVADHPFLFFIKQKSSGVILFLGRFTSPSSHE